jgi:hypothetical protein
LVRRSDSHDLGSMPSVTRVAFDISRINQNTKFGGASRGIADGAGANAGSTPM